MKMQPVCAQIIRSIADDKMWQRIKRLNKASGYRRYLAAFPDGDYKGEAKASLKSLQTTYVVPPKEIKKTRQFCGHPHGKWRVIDIRSDDVLNVRQGPSTRYPIVGAIPPNGSGVRRVECTSRNWCLVKYRCVSGWASGKYLTYNDRKPVGGSASKYYRVIDHTYPDKLNVRRGPGTKFGIVGRIPHNGKNVTVRQCKSIGSRKSRWCIVRWKSVSGWASGRYLANMSNGRRP